MNPIVPSAKQSPSRLWAVGAAVCVVILLLLIGLSYAIITGKTRDLAGSATTSTTGVIETPSSTTTLVPRQLDGVLVAPEASKLRPWAFMIDNQIDARPAEGLAHASVVIESPVEGGITRFLAVFDPLTTSTVRIGAVRSARPYFIDWASAWHAVYGHVGGSPDALDRLAQTPSTTVLDVNEMTRGALAYRRDAARVSPHQVFTTPDRFAAYLGAGATSTVLFSPWRYTSEPVPTSTAVGPTVSVPYGGSYSVRWTYDPVQDSYRRIQSGKALSAEPIYAKNVIVIKTDAQILDDKGRLRLRTTGGGEALLYRDGKKIVGRWRRATNEAMGFVATDGTDLELRAGTTWIEVTTDDLVFAGLTAPASTSTAP